MILPKINFLYTPNSKFYKDPSTSVKSWSFQEKTTFILRDSTQRVWPELKHSIESFVKPKPMLLLTGAVVLGALAHSGYMGHLTLPVLSIIGKAKLIEQAVSLGKSGYQCLRYSIAGKTVGDLQKGAKNLTDCTIQVGFMSLSKLFFRVVSQSKTTGICHFFDNPLVQ